MRKRFWAATVAAVFVAQSAAAAVTIYDCKIKRNGKTSWIPEVLIIAHDENSGDVIVSDPLIFHFNDKKPLPGKVAVSNTKRTTFAWTLKGVKNRVGQYAPQFSFRGTFYRANKSMTITSKPLGYADTFKGRGACEVRLKS